MIAFVLIVIFVCTVFYTTKYIIKTNKVKSITKDLSSYTTSSSKYKMELDEFRLVVIPKILKYNQYNIGFSDNESELLFLSLSDDYVEAKIAKEKLSWSIHEDVFKIASQLMRGYEGLVRAKKDGRKISQISVNEKCSCYGFLNGSLVNTDDMLQAYRVSNFNMPIMPPLETICLLDGERWYQCDFWIRSYSNDLNMFFGVDAGQKAKNLPDNWKEHLLGKAISLFEKKIAESDSELRHYRKSLENFEYNFNDLNKVDLLMSNLTMNNIREIQKRNGVSGGKTKSLAIGTLMASDSSKAEIDSIIYQIKSNKLEELKSNIRRKIGHREYFSEKLHKYNENLELYRKC